MQLNNNLTHRHKSQLKTCISQLVIKIYAEERIKVKTQRGLELLGLNAAFKQF